MDIFMKKKVDNHLVEQGFIKGSVAIDKDFNRHELKEEFDKKEFKFAKDILNFKRREKINQDKKLDIIEVLKH